MLHFTRNTISDSLSRLSLLFEHHHFSNLISIRWNLQSESIAMNYVVRMILMTFILFIFNSLLFLRGCKWRAGRHLPISRYPSNAADLLFSPHNDFSLFLLTSISFKQHNFGLLNDSSVIVQPSFLFRL